MTAPYPVCISAECKYDQPNVWQAPFWVCEKCGLALGWNGEAWQAVNWRPHHVNVRTEEFTPGGVVLIPPFIPPCDSLE